jgi:hypothetical protein
LNQVLVIARHRLFPGIVGVSTDWNRIIHNNCEYSRIEINKAPGVLPGALRKDLRWDQSFFRLQCQKAPMPMAMTTAHKIQRI